MSVRTALRAPGRRGFLAASAAAMMAGAWAPSDAQDAKPARVDVHHHYFPPQYLAAARPATGWAPQMAAWVPQRSLDDMDRGGVQTAMISITTPGLWFGNAAASQKLARLCNEYAADLRRTYPGRFGMFTALPLPDVAASLAEIAYGFDVLKADGVGMFTSYPGKIWFGAPQLDPVFAELNRRNAVVFVHPTTNACCENLTFVDDAIVEYPSDTARTLASYVFSGAAARYPNIRLIFSHGGGTMPFLIGRFLAKAQDPAFGSHVPGGVVPMLQSFYYDTASIENPEALAALTKLVPSSHILFGTDFPYGNAAAQFANIAKSAPFSDADLQAIGARNAAAFFPNILRR